MTLLSPVRVVGVGSPFGDDTVGWAVVAALRDAIAAVPCDVEFHVLPTPDRLLDVLDGRGSLILVDGMVSGSPPGTVLRCEWPDAPPCHAVAPSSHGLSVATILELGARLKSLPESAVVYGVECGHFGPEAVRSSAVAAAVHDVVQAILSELSPR